MQKNITQAAPQTPAAEAQRSERTRPRPVYRPPADIFESGDSVIMVLEMPGVAADGVEVVLEKRVLTISGRSAVTHPEDYRQVYAEYGEGDYERTFTLSQEIDVNRIQASCRNGLLTLELPKAEEAKPRQIDVHAA